MDRADYHNSVVRLLYQALGGDQAYRMVSAGIIEELAALSNVVPPYQPRCTLFEYGSDVDRIFMAWSGLFEGAIPQRNSDRQLSDFYLPADFLDMQSIFTRRHECSVTSITTASIVTIPRGAVIRLERQSLLEAEGYQIRLLDRMGLGHLAGEATPAGRHLASGAVDGGPDFRAHVSPNDRWRA